jgi:hypothetical protein
MSDFDAIEPPCEAVEFGGTLHKITPLRVGQLPAFARAIKPVTSSIEAIVTGKSEFDASALIDIVAEHGESVIEAVSIASRIPAETINDSTLDELIALAVAVMRINADFFKGRLTPAMLAAMKDKAAGAGLTP